MNPPNTPTRRRVLVADDDPENLALISDALRLQKYDVEVANSGSNALEKIHRWRPELVLMDYNMPGLSGLETLALLRKEKNYTAVIFISANTEDELIVQCLESGADDYIRKPFSFSELLARVKVRFRIKDLDDQLVRANRKLRDLAEHDDLTGLLNMRFVYQRMEHEIKRSKRYGRPISCVMMDIDHFKEVNDGFDHLFGSYVLKEIAGIIQRSMREFDFAARYGGDEFLILLTECDETGARSFAERLRVAIANHVCVDGANKFSRTASLGFAVYHPEEDITAKELVRRADHALYEAKEGGRNRVAAFTPHK